MIMDSSKFDSYDSLLDKADFEGLQYEGLFYKDWSFFDRPRLSNRCHGRRRRHRKKKYAASSIQRRKPSGQWPGSLLADVSQMLSQFLNGVDVTALGAVNRKCRGMYLQHQDVVLSPLLQFLESVIPAHFKCDPDSSDLQASFINPRHRIMKLDPHYRNDYEKQSMASKVRQMVRFLVTVTSKLRAILKLDDVCTMLQPCEESLYFQIFDDLCREMRHDWFDPHGYGRERLVRVIHTSKREHIHRGLLGVFLHVLQFWRKEICCPSNTNTLVNAMCFGTQHHTASSQIMESFYRQVIIDKTLAYILPLTNQILVGALNSVLPHPSTTHVLGTNLFSKLILTAPLVDALDGLMRVENKFDLALLSPELEHESWGYLNWRWCFSGLYEYDEDTRRLYHPP